MGASLLKNVKYAEFIGKPKEGETPILRNPDVVDGQLTQIMQFGCETVLQSFEINLKYNRHKSNFIGYRKRINESDLENKFTWITYEEANNLLTNFSLGLNVKDLCPIINIDKEGPFRFLGIFSRNKKEWILSFLGAMKDSITIVTIYETLGDLAVEYILEQTQLITCVIELKALKKILDLLRKNIKTNLKNLIVIEKEFDDGTCQELEKLGLNIYSWEEIEEIGKNEGQNIILKDAKAEDICEINYTSGTTGYPKGVKLTHKNIVVGTDVGELIGLNATTKDVYLSYLPYAHIMETLIITYAFNHGVSIGIYNGDAKKLIDDIQILKPTALCAVPRIFQRIHDSIINKVNSKSLIVRKIFGKAIDIKLKDYQETGLYKNILFDNLIFKDVRKSLGGRLRFMLVGSAPIDGNLLNFLRCSLSVEIMEGYGQTENVAGALLSNTCDPITGHLGGPGWWTEIKLIDQPELEYTSKNIDKKTGKSRPCGEICIRGVSVFNGYFRNPEKTKETIDEEGWLHSGDIGMIIPEHGNALCIIDRKKNIFKLQQGEYISPEKIENIYESCKYIDQIFVYGNSYKNYLVCIIHPNINDVINYLEVKGINNIDKNNCKNYYNDNNLKDEIIREMDEHGRKNGLKGFELPKKIYLFKDRFSNENNIVTPTMKIKRHIAKKFFEKEINKMYEI